MSRGRVSTLSALTLLLAATTAWAQEDTTGNRSATISTELSAPVESDGAFGFRAGTLGIGVVFPTGGDATADLLYFLDPNAALNLQLGVDLSSKETLLPPPAEERETVFGILLGAGYRMYKPLSGRVRPFLEPGLQLGIADFEDAGQTMSLNLYTELGIEFVVVDQFTLGSGIGGALVFANDFADVTFGLFTSPIIATFYW